MVINSAYTAPLLATSSVAPAPCSARARPCLDVWWGEPSLVQHPPFAGPHAPVPIHGRCVGRFSMDPAPAQEVMKSDYVSEELEGRAFALTWFESGRGSTCMAIITRVLLPSIQHRSLPWLAFARPPEGTKRAWTGVSDSHE